MTHFDKTVEILDHLIAFPTISSDSNLDCIDYIAEYLRAVGAEVELSSDSPGKANLFATIGPSGNGGIVLSGHSDVVPVAGQNWTSDPFKMRCDGNKFYGRGTCDMKGFIAACLAKAPDYAKLNLKKPLHFAFTYDEETGCLGAQVLIDSLLKQGLRPSICIIGEPTEMRIIDGHKGCGEYTCEFKGVEGHSSQPDFGVNALEYAARYVARLMQLRQNLPRLQPENSRFEPPHSTLQICGMHAGVAHNVIPNKATVEWEMRYVQESDRAYIRDSIQNYVSDHLLPDMRRCASNCDIQETFVSEIAGLEPDDNSQAVRILAELTGANNTDVVAFGTEAGMFQKIGISAVVCGPGSIAQAHKPNEFIGADQLHSCLGLLERLKEKLI